MAKSRDGTKERYWRGVIRRFEASGLGARRFCKQKRLSEHRLHWWRRTLRQRDRSSARRPRKTRAGGPVRDRKGDSPFLPVSLPFSLGSPIEVVHPRGYVLRVPVIFDPTALSRILAVIDTSAGASGEQ
jgi:hypothetical protein